ncbi:NmrA family transcriptional regulator [Granulosicoccus sp. 3-233]|uniref:NmrA family transcriptional regulator n=1 Tax=Granulosicoccus sp. 3-233 TaxID=3417969 RepID=UPI003D356EDD
MKESPMLIIGRNAKTGLRVDKRLQSLGYVTRGVSRTSSPAFDWEDARTWRAVLDGCESAYVTYYPDLAMPTAESTLRKFVILAREVGLQHLVLLSGRGEQGAERAETLLMNSGLDWNVVRASWFMQNFSEGFMIEGVLQGELTLPAGDIPEPFIDIDDIADVAVAALTRPELRNRLFEVTGPRSMTFTQCVNEISEVVGYPVSFTKCSVEDFTRGLREQGVPEDMLWLMHELFTVVLDGRNSIPTDGVELVLGRPPTDFSEYLRKVMDSGAWHRSGLLQQV